MNTLSESAVSTMMAIGDPAANRHLLLTHGAGASTASPFMQALTREVTARGITVWLYDFAYMRAALLAGKRQPPPKVETLVAELHAALTDLAPRIPEGARLIVGGKSLGGRVATMAAEAAHAKRLIAGVAVVGYPFHPPAKPQSLRTAHLTDFPAPALIVQGDRDPFGTFEDVATYGLAHHIQFEWIEGGDHDLGWKPGRSIAPLTQTAAAIEALFIRLETGGHVPGRVIPPTKVMPSDAAPAQRARGRHT